MPKDKDDKNWKSRKIFEFNLKFEEEIIVHCGYSDFQGKLRAIEESRGIITLESGKDLIEIKMFKIYAITKLNKNKK